MHHPRVQIYLRWAQTSCCRCPSAKAVLRDFRLDQSPRWADGSATGTSPVYCELCHRVFGWSAYGWGTSTTLEMQWA